MGARRGIGVLLVVVLALAVGAGAPRGATLRGLSFSSTSGGLAAPSKASVLIDAGTGRFVTRKPYSAAGSPQVAIGDAVGDLNGDGKPDVVTHFNSDDNDACGQESGVDVCPAYAYLSLSTRSGSFRRRAVFESDYDDVEAAAIADLNGDHRPDLALATADGTDGTGGIAIMLGLGHGRFRAAKPLRTGVGPAAIAAVDVNGDGRRDLITANGGGTVSVLLSRGGGSFQRARTLRLGTVNLEFGFPGLAVGDLNGDRRPDIAVTHYGAGVNVLTVWLNGGRGTFGHKRNYSTGNDPNGVAIGDLNGDRRPDLAVANQSDGTVSVLLGEGGGRFRSRLDYPAGVFPFAVAVGRFDRNSRKDLAVVGFSGQVDFLVGTAGLCNVQDVWGLSLSAATTKLGLAGCAVGTVSHVTSKGFAAGRVLGQSPEAGAVQKTPVDLTVSDGPGPGPIHANPSFSSAHSYTLPKAGQVVAVADLNGDGKPDVVTGNCGNTVSVLLNTGQGSLAARTDYRVASCPDVITLVDLNGDNRPDIVAGDDGGAISVLLNHGDGTFAARQDYPIEQGPDNGGGATDFAAVGDLNGDGKLDLAAVNGFEASHGLTVYFGNGDGSFGARHDYDLAADGDALAVGDLNGDGVLDLAYADLGDVGEIFNQGGGSFVPVKGEYPAGGEGANIFAADLTADGLADVVVTYPDEGSVEVLLDQGGGSLRHFVDYRTAPGPEWVAIGDVNGDGTPDLVVAGKTLSILRGRGDGSFLPGKSYSTGTTAPRAVAIADLNGDGKADLVSANGQALVVRFHT
jgi:hypothetical protein